MGQKVLRISSLCKVIMIFSTIGVSEQRDSVALTG